MLLVVDLSHVSSHPWQAHLTRGKLTSGVMGLMLTNSLAGQLSAVCKRKTGSITLSVSSPCAFPQTVLGYSIVPNGTTFLLLPSQKQSSMNHSFFFFGVSDAL